MKRAGLLLTLLGLALAGPGVARAQGPSSPAAPGERSTPATSIAASAPG